jgi:tetratricopeptide (TPR) repeat protein
MIRIEPERVFRRGVNTLVPTLLVLLLGGLALAASPDDYTKATALMQSGKSEEAAKMLEAIVAQDPADGLAWYGLGLARHQLGDLDGAIEADRKAAEFTAMRSDALYNLACAYGLKGELDPASDALDRAIAAGFLDYDLMKTDSDIEIIRKANRIEYPPEHEYETIKARNGVEFGYKIVLPNDYDTGKTYPALASFAPGGGGTTSCDWALTNLWGESTAEAGWIAVHLLAPERGWMTHPSHHALEELLEDIRKEHKIEDDQFHLVGFGNGARPATTYSGMSGRFFQSLTTVGNRAVARWDDDELERFTQKRVFFIVGGEDDYTLEILRKAEELMQKGGAEVTLTVLEGEDRLPDSMLDGGLLRYLHERVVTEK